MLIALYPRAQAHLPCLTINSHEVWSVTPTKTGKLLCIDEDGASNVLAAAGPHQQW
jgi:hypothetical protein